MRHSHTHILESASRAGLAIVVLVLASLVFNELLSILATVGLSARIFAGGNDLWLSDFQSQSTSEYIFSPLAFSTLTFEAVLTKLVKQ